MLLVIPREKIHKDWILITPFVFPCNRRRDPALRNTCARQEHTFQFKKKSIWGLKNRISLDTLWIISKKVNSAMSEWENSCACFSLVWFCMDFKFRTSFCLLEICSEWHASALEQPKVSVSCEKLTERSQWNKCITLRSHGTALEWERYFFYFFHPWFLGITFQVLQ